MEVSRWLVQHGFSLLESIGIIGGLMFTGVGLHRDSRARRIENLFTLTQHHREIWKQAADSVDLPRALSGERDVLREPPSSQERLIIRALILHLSTVYRAIKLDELLRPKAMESDIRSFFSKPLARDVWNDEKHFQDDDFVAFVERQIKGPLD